jgi:hypothetical protein
VCGKGEKTMKTSVVDYVEKEDDLERIKTREMEGWELTSIAYDSGNYLILLHFTKEVKR